MQKIFFILIMIFFMLNSSSADQKWKKISIDQNIKVKFPVKPGMEKEKRKGFDFNIYTGMYDNYIYQVLVVENVHKLMSQKNFRFKRDLEDFYIGYIGSYIKNPNVKIYTKKDLFIKGFLCKYINYEINYEGNDLFAESIFLYVQGKAYFFQVTVKKKDKMHKQKIDKFFNSIDILLDSNSIKQYEKEEGSSDIAYNIGKFIGTLLPFLLIFFIIRMIYKSVKNKGKNIN